MILSGKKIEQEIKKGKIEIIPFDVNDINPNSYNYTLDNYVKVYEDLYLRIALELYLKTAVAAGFDKVFEIGKNFRNEGMDSSHLQEFTMIEWYEAYWII